MNRISLGCSEIDRLLGGGIEIGSITLLYGEAGAGKTSICLQIARNVTSVGDKVAYVDTEGLSLDRLGQVFGGEDNNTKNLLIFKVHSFNEQSDCIDKIIKLVSSGVVSLIVVDSFTAFYRLGHSNNIVWNAFIRQIETLLNIARQYNIAVLLTSQVYYNIDTRCVDFLGGHVLRHNAKTIIRLDNRYDGKRMAVMIKHRSLPEGKTVLYRITKSGVENA